MIVNSDLLFGPPCIVTFSHSRASSGTFASSHASSAAIEHLNGRSRLKRQKQDNNATVKLIIMLCFRESCTKRHRGDRSKEKKYFRFAGQKYCVPYSLESLSLSSSSSFITPEGSSIR